LAVDNILPNPGIDKALPTPRGGKPPPSREPDGFTAGIDQGEEAGEPLPASPRAKQPKFRQKPDLAQGPSATQTAGQAETEKLKLNLTICRGC
jgi:hypothetical protein